MVMCQQCFTYWLQVVIPLLVQGYDNSSLSVIGCSNFHESAYSEKLLKTHFVFF
jgi:hypothetical protein